jgi:predicted lipoprotein with Yx(FWY)xxD motif
MRRLIVLSLAALAVAVTTAVAAPPRAQIGVRSTTLGSVLVDARGHTLYAYDNGICSGACTASWPPFVTARAPLALKGVKASLIGTMKRSDGTLQVTFAHHALFFFAGDAKAGQVNGAAVPHWSALSPTGAKVHAKPAGSTSTTPAPIYGGGGDGYGP